MRRTAIAGFGERLPVGGASSEPIVLAEIDQPERRQALLHDPPRDLHRLDDVDLDALGPAAQKPRQARYARIGAQVLLERRPRHPSPFAQLAQRLEDHLAQHAGRARVARVGRDAEDLGLAAGLVPRAAATPREKEEAEQLVHRERSGRRRRVDRARLPEPDGAGQRDDDADVRRLATEARGELLDERLRGPDPGPHFVARLTPGERQPHRQRYGIRREPRASRRVVVRLHEAADLIALRLALGLLRGAHDRADLGRHDVAIRVHGHEQSAPLEREAHPASRRRRPRRRAHPQRLSFELQELLGICLAPFALHRLQHAPLGAGQLLDLLGQLRGIAEHLPRGLERERDGGRRGAAEVVRGDRAHGLERRLREERADAAWVLPLPRAELHEIRRRQDELDGRLLLVPSLPFAAAREHEPAGEERLERRRDRRDEERPARLGDAVKQLDARGREARRIARLGERHEETRDLRRGVEALGRIDPDAEPRDERVQLGRRKRTEDIDESIDGAGAIRQGALEV